MTEEMILIEHPGFAEGGIEVKVSNLKALEAAGLIRFLPDGKGFVLTSAANAVYDSFKKAVEPHGKH